MNNNILITGINGFVGSHLSSVLKKDENIIGLVRDQIPSFWLDEALDGITLVSGDIRDYKLVNRVVNHYDIDKIYHIAAFANVKQAYKNPINVFGSNVMGTVNVLEAARNSGSNNIKVLIFNTDKIYGEKLDAIETDRYEASEPYATSKVCQGFVGLSYKKTYGMNVKMSSCCNIYGYDPFNSRLISNVVKQCIKGENPVIWNNDKSIREYIYIDDVVDATIRIMDKEEKYDIYNIRTGYLYNQRDVILKILDCFKCMFDVQLEPSYIDKNIQYQIQEESMQSVNWDWKPSCSFDNGLIKTINKFVEYKDDWK